MRIPAPSSDMPLARRVPEIRHDRSPGHSSNRCSRDRRNHGAPESKPNPASQKSTTLLWTEWSLSKGVFAHFRGFVVWSVHVSKSSHPRIDRTLSVRRIVMLCFRPDESPKFGIVLRSSNGRSRDRRNHVVPESKPNPASPQLYFENEAFFFSISYQNIFFSTLSRFRRFRGFVVWSVQVSKSDRPRIDHTLSVRRIFFLDLNLMSLVPPKKKKEKRKKNEDALWSCSSSIGRTLSVRITVREHALWSCSNSKRFLPFLPLKIHAHNYTLKM